MSKRETRPDETQRFGMEVTRIGRFAMQANSKEQQVVLRKDIASFVESADVPTMFKEQLLSTVAGHAKHATDRQWAVDRLAELSEVKRNRDIEDGVQRVEDYANEGFIDEIERDAQVANDEHREAKQDEIKKKAVRGAKERDARNSEQDFIDDEFGSIVAREEAADKKRKSINRKVAVGKQGIGQIEAYLGPSEKEKKDKENISKAMETLDAESRLIIEAVYFTHKDREKGVEEVAQELGLSVGRVKEIRDDAIKKLKKFEEELLGP